MPSQAKTSLLLALLLSSSYLLLSTCGRTSQDLAVSGEEIPADTPQVQPSEDIQDTQEAGVEPAPGTEANPGGIDPTPVQSAQRTQSAGSEASQSRSSTSARRVPDTSSRSEPQPVPLTVTAGETIDIEFRQTLSSHTSQVGQPFKVRVTQPVQVGGKVAIPAGASIHGEVLEAEPAKKIGGRARLALDFRSLTLANGATYPIEAVFSQAGKSQTGKDAAIIGGATLGGAILGKQVGGDTGTIIGAVAGGIGGAFAAKKTKGKPVEVPAGTMMILELTQPVTIDVLP